MVARVITSDMAEIRPFLTALDFEVKTYDVDFASHVNNQVYIRWLEDLRFELLKRHYPLEPQLQAGVVPLLTRTDITYRRAIRLFEPVRGVMWMHKVSAMRIYLTAKITVGEQLCADVIQEGAFVRAEDGRSLKLPDELRALFASWVEPGAEA